jgi:hypothetical protein
MVYVDAKDSLPSRMVKQLKPVMALARIAEETYVPYDVWSGIVEAYSRSKLTYESDKLVALAGLAMEIAQIFQRDDYLAGLWQSGLPYSLMWTAHGDTDNTIVRPSKYRAPSWSWASLDGNITFPDIFKNAVAEVIDVAVSTERDVFGPVVDGSLILKGLLFKPPTGPTGGPIPLQSKRFFLSSPRRTCRVSIVVGTLPRAHPPAKSCQEPFLPSNHRPISFPKSPPYYTRP